MWKDDDGDSSDNKQNIEIDKTNDQRKGSFETIHMQTSNKCEKIDLKNWKVSWTTKIQLNAFILDFPWCYTRMVRCVLSTNAIDTLTSEQQT